MAQTWPANTFRWQAGCACCGKTPEYSCRIFDDGFGLPDGSDLDPENWEVTSGSWSIQSFSAIPGSASENSALSIPPNPTAHEHASITAAIIQVVSQTSCYVIVKNDMWGGLFRVQDGWEWRIGQGALTNVIDSVGAGLFPDPTIITVCYDATRQVLILNAYDPRRQDLSDYLVKLEEPVADNGGTRAGMGGVGCRIDSFRHNVAGHDDGPDEYIYCPRCTPGVDPCAWCNVETTPSLLEVSISGIFADQDSWCRTGTVCSELDGDYTLPMNGCGFGQVYDVQLNCDFYTVDRLELIGGVLPLSPTQVFDPYYLGIELSMYGWISSVPGLALGFGYWRYHSSILIPPPYTPAPYVDCVSWMHNQLLPASNWLQPTGIQFERACEWMPDSQAIISVLA